MKAPKCPACGGRPTIADIKRRYYGHNCPHLLGKQLYWNRDGRFSPIRIFVAAK